MLDLNRVHKELREVESSKHLSGVSVELIGDDLTHLRGSLNGPEDTPYQGGVFLLDINLPCTVVRSYGRTLALFKVHVLRGLFQPALSERRCRRSGPANDGSSTVARSYVRTVVRSYGCYGQSSRRVVMQ